MNTREPTPRGNVDARASKGRLVRSVLVVNNVHQPSWQPSANCPDDQSAVILGAAMFAQARAIGGAVTQFGHPAARLRAIASLP